MQTLEREGTIVSVLGVSDDECKINPLDMRAAQARLLIKGVDTYTAYFGKP